MGKFNEGINTGIGADLATLKAGSGRGNTRGTNKSILVVISPELREAVDRRIFDLSSPGHIMTLNGYIRQLIEKDIEKYEREEAKKTKQESN